MVRIILGLGALSLVRFGPQTPWGYLGFLPLLTGALGWSPVYALLLSTIPQAPRPAP